MGCGWAVESLAGGGGQQLLQSPSSTNPAAQVNQPGSQPCTAGPAPPATCLLELVGVHLRALLGARLKGVAHHTLRRALSRLLTNSPT